jgi:hypothetical protein
VTDGVKEAAREAESSRTFRRLARGGFAANGLVHILVGALVLVVAFGGDVESDQAGAFRAIGAVPLGFVALWIIAIALWALAAWHAVEGLLARAPSGGARGAASKWRIRISEWGQAIVFAALGAVSAAVAVGARPDAEAAVEAASRGILSIPGGAFLLGAIGVGFFVTGVVFVVMGARRTFRGVISIPPGARGRAVTALGIVGFVAKGIALAIIGVLLTVAAVRIEPDAAGGLDGAIAALLDLAYGPWLAGIVGAGLIAYGVFCCFRARYARL